MELTGKWNLHIRFNYDMMYQIYVQDKQTLDNGYLLKQFSQRINEDRICFLKVMEQIFFQKITTFEVQQYILDLLYQ